MKQLLLFILLSTIIGFSAEAQVSAVRKPNESYLDIAKGRAKIRASKNQFQIGSDAYGARSTTPDLTAVSSWKGGDLSKAFSLIRDERFMKDDEGSSRRPTWLYPYDGCFARAEVAAQRLTLKGFPPPSKIFVFGDLVVHSKNASDLVTWWYHVAAAYRMGETVYVFDPAIEPQKLLTLKEWDESMGTSTKEYSICDAGTFDPDSSCEAISQMSYEESQRQQSYFFEDERLHLLDLGRNPTQELGENPPWKN